MQFVLRKVKEGKLELWRNWCELLRTVHRDEARETLKEEGVTYEAFLCFELNDQWYSLGCSTTPTHPTNLDRELNRKHRAMRKECLESASVPLDVLYDFRV